MMIIFGIIFIVFGSYIIIHEAYFGIVLLVFGSIRFFFVWQDRRNFTGKSRYKNYWLTTHIQRMVAKYTATATDFLFLNNNVLPDTIAWLLPTILLAPFIIKWMVKHNIIASARKLR